MRKNTPQRRKLLSDEFPFPGYSQKRSQAITPAVVSNSIVSSVLWKVVKYGGVRIGRLAFMTVVVPGLTMGLTWWYIQRKLSSWTSVLPETDGWNFQNAVDWTQSWWS